MMDSKKKQRLESKGWKSASVSEFLQLSPEENTVVEMKLALSNLLKQVRSENQLTQNALALQIGTDQARVSRLENHDPGVSTDLLLLALLTAGATPERIARTISTIPSPDPIKERELTPTG